MGRVKWTKKGANENRSKMKKILVGRRKEKRNCKKRLEVGKWENAVTSPTDLRDVTERGGSGGKQNGGGEGFVRCKHRKNV